MITSWEQYNALEALVDQARDRLITGEGPSGIHYELMAALNKHGIFIASREEAIKKAQRLLSDFMAAQQAEDDNA